MTTNTQDAMRMLLISIEADQNEPQHRRQVARDVLAALSSAKDAQPETATKIWPVRYLVEASESGICFREKCVHSERMAEHVAKKWRNEFADSVYVTVTISALYTALPSQQVAQPSSASEPLSEASHAAIIRTLKSHPTHSADKEKEGGAA